MKPALHVLVVAKAPVAGVAKTRLAADLGGRAAADLAAAALLDTIGAAEDATDGGARLLALAGDLAQAERGREIADQLASWHVVPQRGQGFADRLVNAHRDAATRWGERALVVQIGMDTPQVAEHDLVALARAAIAGGPTGCGLGLVLDGGWWGLSTMSAGYADALTGVPMSCPQTGRLTAAALRRAGARVTTVHELQDVDVLPDAIDVSRCYPALAFSETFATAYVDEVAR